MTTTPTSGLLEVVVPGFGTSLQDRGRPGHRHQGIPLSGWLDGPLAEAANALVGNAGGEAVLELRGMGTELRVRQGPVRVALSGQVQAQWLRADGNVAVLPAWHSATLAVGDRLRLGAASTGCAYLAVCGGLRVPPQLGSRSSYGRAGLPGVLGRALQPSDTLPCGAWTAPDPREWRSPVPWSLADGAVRVVLGPQADHFTAAALDSFLAQDWTTTAEQDRMGLRLTGSPLAHLRPSAADIVSDAVTPGAIQVPANGLPIVLLADSQTVGGYPKIATVIRADLPRLAHARPGTRLRFQAVGVEQARLALAQQRDDWLRWLGRRQLYLPAGLVDEAALYGSNLVSGMVRADACALLMDSHADSQCPP